MELAVQRHLKTYGTSANVGVAAGDGYERTPKAEKALQKYQHRIGRSPTQCLRYAYDTDPLWPSPKEDLEEHVLKVPCCACGAKRVFELQLLSTVLNELDVDSCRNQGESKQNCSRGSSGGENEEQRRRRMMMNNGGMDWSTVLVYSCADSCTRSHEEVVVVHRPL